MLTGNSSTDLKKQIVVDMEWNLKMMYSQPTRNMVAVHSAWFSNSRKNGYIATSGQLGASGHWDGISWLYHLLRLTLIII